MSNGSTSPRPSFTEGVAQRVLDACKCEDPDSRITYVGRDETGRTRVRVRSGNGASVQSLQRALQRLMPFAKVRTSEDVLDGSAQAEICVPTAGDEYAMAQAQAGAMLSQRALAVGAVACTVVGWACGPPQSSANWPMTFNRHHGAMAKKALDIAATCTAAAASSEPRDWPSFTVLFSVYIALDSLLAASVIVRKAAEAEAVTGRMMA